MIVRWSTLNKKQLRIERELPDESWISKRAQGLNPSYADQDTLLNNRKQNRSCFRLGYWGTPSKSLTTSIYDVHVTIAEELS